MARGGGTLGKIFPGYKSKIWNRFPNTLKRYIIHGEACKEMQYWNTICVKRNSQMRWFHNHMMPMVAPCKRGSLAAVDYKRQMSRGTLVEGTDMYSANGTIEHRLRRLYAPYSEEEQQERRKYRYQNFAYYFAAAFVFSVYHSHFQNRPIAWCADQEHPGPPHYPFWVKSILHGHDIPSVRRGFEVYKTVCATCHSMKFFKFRHLVNDVYPEEAVKKIAAEYDVEDGPDSKGEMFKRPGLPTDSFPSPYPNEEAATYANGGVTPPDLSNISSARMHGPDYLFALLTGYYDPPEGISLRPGMYWNLWFPGNTIAMPAPLQDDMIDYEDGTASNLSQMAKDVTNFFIWSAEPGHDERKVGVLKATCFGVMGILAFTSWYRFYAVGYITRRIDFSRHGGL